MKKSILLILACSLSLFGQKDFYIGVQAGYGFNFGAQTNYDYSLNETSQVLTYKSNPLNLGSGAASAITAGCFFNKNIGTELNIGYLAGNEHTDGYIGTPSMNDSKEKFSFTTLYLNPSILFKTKVNKIQPYAKMGLFLGLINKITDDNIYNGILYSTLESKKGLPFGFTASLGTELILGKHFGIYGEMFGRFASYSPSTFRYELLTESYNNSIAPNPNGNLVIEGKYKDEASGNDNKTRPSVSYPINALGFNIGLRYYFKPKD